MKARRCCGSRYVSASASVAANARTAIGTINLAVIASGLELARAQQPGGGHEQQRHPRAGQMPHWIYGRSPFIPRHNFGTIGATNIESLPQSSASNPLPCKPCAYT